jgi:hypothetical protein
MLVLMELEDRILINGQLIMAYSRSLLVYFGPGKNPSMIEMIDIQLR